MPRSTSGSGGKSHDRRPRAANISRAEYELRYDLAVGNIDRNEFDRKLKCLEQAATLMSK